MVVNVVVFKDEVVNWLVVGVVVVNVVVPLVDSKIDVSDVVDVMKVPLSVTMKVVVPEVVVVIMVSYSVEGNVVVPLVTEVK